MCVIYKDTMVAYESILFSLIIGECNIIDPAIDIAVSSDGHTLYAANTQF